MSVDAQVGDPAPRLPEVGVAPPARGRGWRRRAMHWLIGLAAFYVVWLVFLYLMQERLIFPGTYLRRDGDSIARPGDAEVIWLTPAPGVRVEAWLLPALNPRAERVPLVVAAHGNAELIDDHAWFLRRYRELGCALLLVEYRGFARSTGTPGQAALVADFLDALERVAARPEIDPQRVIYHGRSVGAGVMAQVADRRPPAGMILESAFTSLAWFAPRYGAPPALLRHAFRTDRVLPAFRMPLLILHGDRDEIIPVSHGRRLHELAPHATYLEMPAGHNDFPPDEDEYWRVIERFLRENHWVD